MFNVLFLVRQDVNGASLHLRLAWKDEWKKYTLHGPVCVKWDPAIC